MTGLPDVQRAALVALSTLPELGPARLRALLDAFGDPAAAWAAVEAGRLDGVPLRRRPDTRPALVRRWADAARARAPADVLDEHRRRGVSVLAPGDPDWPDALVGDPEPPELLFVTGDAALLGQVSVAVVGTRRCTAAGVATASSLGAGLASAGVPVVSGLAIGIDGAAHRGVLEGGGRPVGVVATGIDVVYPARHRRLWSEVGERGVLVSEAALGVGPERWRFPARNRLIAALASLVVVVESRERGGSMSTVDAAEARGTDVYAVPGSVLAEQSAGTNQLLHEGCGVVRDTTDVLTALGTSVPLVASRRSEADTDDPTPDDPFLAGVAAVLSPTASSIEAIATAVDAPLASVATALARLEAGGHAHRVGSGYRKALP